MAIILALQRDPLASVDQSSPGGFILGRISAAGCWRKTHLGQGAGAKAVSNFRRGSNTAAVADMGALLLAIG